MIDLQQNSGGQPLLAMDTFQQFFPDVIPYAGSRMRAHDNANTMGSTLTGTWDSLNETHDWYEQLAANEWVVTDRINAATHQNFTSWAQFFGPNSSYSGDSYTSIVSIRRTLWQLPLLTCHANQATIQHIEQCLHR